MNEAIIETQTPEETIQRRESYFLDNRAKTINDDIWMGVSSERVKMSRASRNAEVNHEMC